MELKSLVLNSGSVLGLNPTKALGLKGGPSRKTSLSNAIYGNSGEFSDVYITMHPPLMGPRT